MNEREYPAKFATAEECLVELRKRAANCAVRFLAITAAFEKKKARPVDLARISARLDAWCTAIEVLTVGGTYYAERTVALEEARRQAASK